MIYFVFLDNLKTVGLRVQNSGNVGSGYACEVCDVKKPIYQERTQSKAAER